MVQGGCFFPAGGHPHVVVRDAAAWALATHTSWWKGRETVEETGWCFQSLAGCSLVPAPRPPSVGRSGHKATPLGGVGSAHSAGSLLAGSRSARVPWAALSSRTFQRMQTFPSVLLASATASW